MHELSPEGPEKRHLSNTPLSWVSNFMGAVQAAAQLTPKERYVQKAKNDSIPD
jgi:hypothetical protein